MNFNLFTTIAISLILKSSTVTSYGEYYGNDSPHYGGYGHPIDSYGSGYSEDYGYPAPKPQYKKGGRYVKRSYNEIPEHGRNYGYGHPRVHGDYDVSGGYGGHGSYGGHEGRGKHGGYNDNYQHHRGSGNEYAEESHERPPHKSVYKRSYNEDYYPEYGHGKSYGQERYGGYDPHDYGKSYGHGYPEEYGYYGNSGYDEYEVRSGGGYGSYGQGEYGGYSKDHENYGGHGSNGYGEHNRKGYDKNRKHEGNNGEKYHKERSHHGEKGSAEGYDEEKGYSKEKGHSKGGPDYEGEGEGYGIKKRSHGDEITFDRVFEQFKGNNIQSCSGNKSTKLLDLNLALDILAAGNPNSKDVCHANNQFFEVE